MGLSLLKDIISSKQSRSKKPQNVMLINLYHNHSSIVGIWREFGGEGG